MKPWKIVYNGRTLTDDDLLNSDLVDAQLLVDDGWNSVNVWASPLHALCAVAVLIARLDKRNLEAVTAELKAAKAGTIVPELREIPHDKPEE